MKPAAPPKIFWYLITTYFFCGLAVSGGRVAASLYCLKQGLSESSVGVLFGLYGLLPMFFSVMVGRLVDRVGPASPMRIGCALLVFAFALVVILPQTSAMFVMAACCGIGLNIVTVSGQYVVGKLQDGDSVARVRNYGWFSIGQSSGNVLGPLLAGFVIDLYSYQVVFIVMIAAALIALVCVLYKHTALSKIHLPSIKVVDDTKSAETLISTPDMRNIYIVGIMLSMSWDIFLFLIPIVGHRLQFSASVVGAILSSFAIGTFMVRLMMPRISIRFNEWQILTGSIAIIIGVYILLPLIKFIPLLFLLGFIFGMAVGCSQPNMLSLLHSKAPKGRGAEAVGFRQMLCNASGVIVPGMFGGGAAVLGVVPIFWSVALFMTLALPLALREQRRVVNR
jgi:MFS family permease